MVRGGAKRGSGRKAERAKEEEVVDEEGARKVQYKLKEVAREREREKERGGGARGGGSGATWKSRRHRRCSETKEVRKQGKQKKMMIVMIKLLMDEGGRRKGEEIGFLIESADAGSYGSRVEQRRRRQVQEEPKTGSESDAASLKGSSRSTSRDEARKA
jgi:hypothetical protein